MRKVFEEIISLITKASELAKTVGIPNLLQPGLVKEIIIADKLGHKVIATKREADACDPTNNSIVYEYLSCKEGNTGQLDRMFKRPKSRRQESLNRIRRNNKIYFVVFYATSQLRVKVIYELEPQDVALEAERKLDKSSNKISHIGFSEKWAKDNGTVVYQDVPPDV